MKTERDLQAEVSATIKLVLTEMEDLAVMAPEDAYPYAYEERRQRVMKKIWNLYKLLSRPE